MNISYGKTLKSFAFGLHDSIHFKTMYFINIFERKPMCSIEITYKSSNFDLSCDRLSEII